MVVRVKNKLTQLSLLGKSIMQFLVITERGSRLDTSWSHPSSSIAKGDYFPLDCER